MKKVRIALILICVLIVTNEVFSQALIAKIPFEKKDNHTYIRIQVNKSKKTYLFIFDTGAGGTIVSSDLVRELNLHLTQKDTLLDMAGGSESVKMSLKNSITLGDEQIHNIDFYVQESLPPFIGSEKIWGVIGYDLLVRYTSKIDFEKKYLSLYAKNTGLNPEAEEIPFVLLDGIPVIKHQITTPSGRKLTCNLVFDSGAGFAMSLNASFNNKYNLISELPKKSKVQVIGASQSNPFDNYISTMPSISIGSSILTDVPLNISMAKEGITSGDEVDGVIGIDIIGKFNVILDYEKKTIKLIPNSNYVKPFKFNLTGLHFKKNTEGKIYISNVLEHSSAEEVGLKKGDIIISMNKSTINEIEELKSGLSELGKRNQLIVLRDGKMMEFEIESKRFY